MDPFSRSQQTVQKSVLSLDAAGDNGCLQGGVSLDEHALNNFIMEERLKALQFVRQPQPRQLQQQAIPSEVLFAKTRPWVSPPSPRPLVTPSNPAITSVAPASLHQHMRHALRFQLQQQQQALLQQHQILVAPLQATSVGLHAESVGFGALAPNFVAPQVQHVLQPVLASSSLERKGAALVGSGASPTPSVNSDDDRAEFGTSSNLFKLPEADIEGLRDEDSESGKRKREAGGPRPNSLASHGQPSSRKQKDATWLRQFEALQRYKAEHGDCLVPRGFPPNPRLASWVAEQRKQYKLRLDSKQSSITQERIDQLNTLEFAWNAQDFAWSRQIEDLKRFKQEYGHCHVPLNHPQYPKLGLWVKEQRRHFALLKQGKRSHMTQKRFEELSGMSFCWDTHEASWLERLRQLSLYKEKYGDCLVPAGWPENPRLSTWVHHQRRQYKQWMMGRHSHINEERIKTLETMGFCWNARDLRLSDDEDAQQETAIVRRKSTAVGEADSSSDPSEPRRKRARLDQ